MAKRIHRHSGQSLRQQPTLNVLEKGKFSPTDFVFITNHNRRYFLHTGHKGGMPVLCL
jgi:hypothetical protein